ncbi:MAG: hypothetical protein EDM05_024770 [Leptolyngbya sp. IPPAS B-1204]|uniref:Uncharacterized protein n=1 Tax=Leptolyngbya sp. NK1-12 TaxID=2547451 RepID=A0AA97AG35_9CYAN|nr:hypothetical protein [Leptolyngbya sp. NK1-12]MBF2047213.1 hypothetical protein [Elainella sp. C42_A2020_010]RNJ67698.1 MAG: hypothetical protein EDM05_19480 [Leptolyngbya sp. IPPAS B-1204]WNZ23024.1 hypothetical protein HJG54_09240 [Leptolyngbya sp. NK1-12]
MNWEEGQTVECEGLDWGPCYVTMSNQHMVVIYCPRYEMVTTASPNQLEQAGWKSTAPKKVVWMQKWRQANRQKRKPVPGV